MKLSLLLIFLSIPLNELPWARYILICRSFMSLRWSILQRLQWKFHSQQTTILLMTETWTMHICFAYTTTYLQMACIIIRSHSYFSSLIWKLSVIDFAYHRCRFSAETSFYFERKDQEIVFIYLIILLNFFMNTLNLRYHP